MHVENQPLSCDEPEDPRLALRQTALGLLARREHSRLELQNKLAVRGGEPDIIKQTLDELISENLLSDKRFTEAYVQNRSERGFGPLKIRAELYVRGIGDDLINLYLSKLAGSWSRLIEQVWDKKFGARRTEDHKERVKQARYLQQRGFTGEQIRSLLKI